LKRRKVQTRKEQSLEIYREQIQRITKSILDLALARQALSLRIANAKKSLGENVENAEVEKKLFSFMTEYSKSIGLNDDLARTIVTDLIRFSKIAQSENIYRSKITKFLSSKNIETVSVVGAGRMGGWFARYFQGLGVEVFLYDERGEKAKARAQEIRVGHLDNLGKVAKSDLIVISIPITKTPSLIRALITNIHKKSSKRVNVIEISSVKNEMGSSGLFDEKILGTSKVALYSMHPLFGGHTQSFERNSIIQVFPKDTSFLKGIFPHSNVVFLDWRDHDRLMASFLTLPHLLALVFADSLTSPSRFGEEVKNLSGPSFSHMMELSKRTLSEDPDVYFEIQTSNPNSKAIISDLISSVRKFRKALRSRSDFEAFFEETKHRIES